MCDHSMTHIVKAIPLIRSMTVQNCYNVATGRRVNVVFSTVGILVFHNNIAATRQTKADTTVISFLRTVDDTRNFHSVFAPSLHVQALPLLSQPNGAWNDLKAVSGLPLSVHYSTHFTRGAFIPNLHHQSSRTGDKCC